MVFIIWGRKLPLVTARKCISRLLCVACDPIIEKGLGCICNIFFCLTYVEPRVWIYYVLAAAELPSRTTNVRAILSMHSLP